jgi:hypothetical protein
MGRWELLPGEDVVIWKDRLTIVALVLSGPEDRKALRTIGRMGL